MEQRKRIRWEKDVCTRIFIFMLFTLGTASAVGSPKVDNVNTISHDWLSQWDVPRIIITMLLGVCAFFLIRTLDKFDRNQTEIFNRLRVAETTLAGVKAVCEERKCNE